MAFQSRYLKKGEFVYILRELYLGSETGTLSLSSEQSTKFFYMKDGSVIFAASNNPEDKFTSILIRQGKITTEQYEMAMKKKGDNTIGKALVEVGFISSEELIEALGNQVANIAKAVVNWGKGMASFKKNVLPPKVVQLNIDMPRFIVDTTLAVDDRDWVVGEMGGMNSVFFIAQPSLEIVQKIAVFPEEKKMLQSIDGRRSVKVICDELGGDAFRWAKYIYSLYLLGHLKKKDTLQFVDVASQHEETPSSTIDLSFLDENNKLPETAPEPKQPMEEERLEDETTEGEKEERKDEEIQILFSHQPGILTESEPIPDIPDVKPAPPIERIVMKKKPSRRPFLFILFIIVIIGGGTLGIFLWKKKMAGSAEAPVIQKKKPQISQVAPPEGAEKYFNGKESNSIQTTTAPVNKLPQPGTPPKKESEKGKVVTAALKVPSQPVKKEIEKPGQSGISLLSSGRYSEAAGIFYKETASTKGQYTIQIEIACLEDTVAKAVTGSSKSPSLWVTKINYRGNSCYRVLWGKFNSKEDAEKSVKNLPDYFRDTKPAIVNISSIR